MTTGKVRFSLESNNVATYAEGLAATFANGQGDWTHIVVTAEADTQLLIYINGSAITLGAGAAAGDGDASGLTFANWTSADNTYLGGINLGGAVLLGPIEGNIDDVRIFNKLLTAVDVKNLYELTRWRFGR